MSATCQGWNVRFLATVQCLEVAPSDGADEVKWLRMRHGQINRTDMLPSTIIGLPVTKLDRSDRRKSAA